LELFFPVRTKNICAPKGKKNKKKVHLVLALSAPQIDFFLFLLPFVRIITQPIIVGLFDATQRSKLFPLLSSPATKVTSVS
jgi:hypothetical protein